MKVRTERRVLTGMVAVGVAALTLASCATGRGNTEQTQTEVFTPQSEVNGELTVMGFSGVDEIATTRMDIAQKAIGETSVKLVEGELDLQQFLSSLAAGSPPDLIYANRDQVGSLAARGAIIPLDECIRVESIDVDSFVPSAIQQVTLEDTVYGIPEFNSVQIIMANQDLLSDADLNVEDVNGSDWQAVSHAGATMMERQGSSLSVIGYDPKLPEFFPLWVKANGADLLSSDGRTAHLDSPEAVEALTWAVEIYDEQGGFSTVKSVRDSADFFGSGNQFATNALGAMPMEQWYLNVLNDVSPDAPMAFDTVKTREDVPLAYATGSAWAVPRDSKNPAAACRWASAMTAPETWEAAGRARLELRTEEGKPFTGVLTGNMRADQLIRDMVNPGGEPWSTGVEAMYMANDHTFSLPASPADAEFKDAMFDAVNAVLNGQSTPEEALHGAQENAQRALDTAWATVDQEG